MKENIDQEWKINGQLNTSVCNPTKQQLKDYRLIITKYLKHLNNKVENKLVDLKDSAMVN